MDTKEFNPHPVTHRDGSRTPDTRYKITREHSGKAKPQFVARFCDEFIGQSAFYTSAVVMAVGHNAMRLGEPVIVEQRASRAELTPEQQEEVRECHPESKLECYCDNGHVQNETTCMYCWFVAENENEGK